MVASARVPSVMGTVHALVQEPMKFASTLQNENVRQDERSRTNAEGKKCKMAEK
jgi:hypothetical protein